MPSTTENLAALDGDLKVVYGKELVKVLPEAAIVQKRHKLETGGDYPMVGDFFSALIGVQLPAGFSFPGNGTEGTATNTDLGTPLAGQTKPAEIYPCMTVLTDNLSYFVLDRASRSGSEQAVLSAMAYTGEQMAISMRNVLELEILHGRQGIGASSAGISTLTVTLDPATTSPGILSMLIGFRLQWMQSNLTSARTANDSSNYLTVSAVDVSVPTAPTLTMVATGTTNVAAITTGDVMFIAGTRGVSVASSDTNVPYYEQIGIGLQLETLSGTQFAIDKSAYIAWRANVQPSIGAFSPSALMTAAATSIGRGGKLGAYEVLLPVAAWGVLNSALATNEVYNNPAGFSMSKKTGTDEIMVYHGGIKIECIPHPFQKTGKFYMYPGDELKRIGSTDMTFSIPGKKGGEEYFYPIADKAVMQRQCRADFQCVLLTPPSGIAGTGITYS